MSDGSWDSMKWLLQDKDAIDGKDWLDFDDTEITEIVKNLNKKYPQSGDSWLDFSSWLPKEHKCTCGSEKTHGKGGAHSDWCDKKRI